MDITDGIGFLGRSVNGTLGSLHPKISQVQALPFFRRDRDPGDSVFITGWVVDSLGSLDAYDADPDAVCDIESFRGREISSPRDLPGFFPDTGSGTVIARFHGPSKAKDSGMNVSVIGQQTAAGDRRFELWFRNTWLELVDAKTENFLTGMMNLLGLGDALTFSSQDNRRYFHLSARSTSKGEVLQVGQSHETEGRVEANIGLGMDSAENAASFLEAVHRTWNCRKVEVQEILLCIPPKTDWNRIRRWLEVSGFPGPWNFAVVNLRGMGWKPSQLKDGTDSSGPIPLGLIDFTGRIRGFAIEKVLRNQRVFVDLFREGEGWHLAFHLLEEYYSLKMLRQMRAALNKLFGADIVVRGAEDIWPDLF